MYICKGVVSVHSLSALRASSFKSFLLLLLLFQVHACNMLRTLFRDAMLGDEMLTFAADGIVLSLAGLASPSWAMRNASTLLFSTCAIVMYQQEPVMLT